MANEKRLIDLDEAIDALGVEDKDIYCKHFLEERPTVDAVEVCRCKDCKHYEWNPFGSGRYVCSKLCKGAYEDFFCSYGERREGE